MCDAPWFSESNSALVNYWSKQDNYIHGESKQNSHVSFQLGFFLSYKFRQTSYMYEFPNPKYNYTRANENMVQRTQASNHMLNRKE